MKRQLRAGLRLTFRVLSTLFLLACLSAVAVPLYGALTKSYRLQPVLSGSMEPGLYRGDLAWVRPKPRAALKVGDVLVFNSPTRGSTPSRRVIHRVIQFVDPTTIRTDQAVGGASYVRTQGDNNPNPDPWIAAVDDDQVWVQTGVVRDAAWPLLVAGDAGPRVFGLLGGGVLLVGWAVSTLRSGLRPATPAPRRAAPARAQTSRHAPSGVAFWVVMISALTLAGAGLGAAVSALYSDNETTAAGVKTGAVTVVADVVSIAVADLLSGEEIGRVVPLRNTGTLALGTLQVEVSAAGDPELLDPTTGLQFRVERCPVAWSGSDAATCSAPVTVVVADRPLVGRTDVDLSTVSAVAPGGVDQLRVVLRLPADAPPETAELAATVRIAFLARQRAGTVR